MGDTNNAIGVTPGDVTTSNCSLHARPLHPCAVFLPCFPVFCADFLSRLLDLFLTSTYVVDSAFRRWNAMALRVKDCQNRTATELAAENGHAAIADELNQLEARRQDERLFLRPASPSPRRPSQDSGLDLALC